MMIQLDTQQTDAEGQDVSDGGDRNRHGRVFQHLLHALLCRHGDASEAP